MHKIKSLYNVGEHLISETRNERATRGKHMDKLIDIVLANPAVSVIATLVIAAAIAYFNGLGAGNCTAHYRNGRN